MSNSNRKKDIRMNTIEWVFCSNASRTTSFATTWWHVRLWLVNYHFHTPHCFFFFFFSTTQNFTCQGSGKSCVHKLSFVLFLSMSKLIEKYECHSKLYLPQSRHDHIEARKDTCSPLYHAVSFGFLKHEHHSRLLDLSSPNSITLAV